jgi:hypothetical protein
MQIQRFQAQRDKDKPECCENSGRSAHLILDRSVSKEMLAHILARGGFAEVEYQTKAGILYVESKVLVASGAFGRNRLQVRCKLGNARVEECKREVESFIEALKTIQ